ncbi:MAG: hypothetical protein KDC84_09410 [Crocinitomicaceae bacterium]|nr:hypothetical protein [Crocinitomicaceae bacterium]
MKRLRFLLIIPLFLCFILVYLISNAFLRRDEPLIHNYIPDEVDVLIEFDIKHFGSAFMYNMMYNSAYFNEKIPLPTGTGRKDIPSMGISPANNFVFAVEKWGTGDFYYLIFQLESKRLFDDFVGKLAEQNKNLVYASNNEVGIFGFAKNVDKKVASDYLDEVIHKNVESIRTKYDLNEKFNLDRDINIHFNTQAYLEGSQLQNIFASLDLVSSSAIMDVHYTSNEKYEVEPINGKVLKAKNLHVSSSMKMEDILNTFGMKTYRSIKEFPKINKWSINNLGSLFHLENNVPMDSVNEVYRFKSSFGEFIVDNHKSFGIYIPELKRKISLNTQNKFEILFEPESKEEFERYFKGLADTGYIAIDSAKHQMNLGPFGVFKYKWMDKMFILFPTDQVGVDLVDIKEPGTYFYMDFDLNPFFKNFEMMGANAYESMAFTGILGNFQEFLKAFDRVEVGLSSKGENIQLNSTLSFKNREGVAIIEMMSAFLNSNFRHFFIN